MVLATANKHLIAMNLKYLNKKQTEHAGREREINHYAPLFNSAYSEKRKPSREYLILKSVMQQAT